MKQITDKDYVMKELVRFDWIILGGRHFGA